MGSLPDAVPVGFSDTQELTIQLLERRPRREINH
jgi:hypothetical protein